MKKLFISFFIMFTISFSCFAKDVLEWNLTYDKYCKKVKVDNKFEDENYTIVYLPQNSIFKNDFDEYLLFEKNGKKKILTRKLESLPYGKDECINFVKEKYGGYLLYSRYTNNSGFFNKKLRNDFEKYYYVFPNYKTKEFYNKIGLPKFPDKYSPEVIFLTKLRNLQSFDDAFEPSYNVMYCGFIFLSEDNSYVITQSTEANSKQDDLDTIINEVVNHIMGKEPQNVDELIEKYPAPFGLAWGLESNNLTAVSNKCKQIDYNDKWFLSEGLFLRENIQYDNYYDCYKISNTDIYSIEPKEFINEIPFYYVFCDSYNGLYQIFTVPYYSLSYGEEISKCIKGNESEYEKIKKDISKKYGQPTIKNNRFVSWKTDNNVKIDLFIESKTTTVYNDFHKNGIAGNEDFTCLVYTNLNLYEKIINRIEKQKKEWEEWLSK